MSFLIPKPRPHISSKFRVDASSGPLVQNSGEIFSQYAEVASVRLNTLDTVDYEGNWNREYEDHVQQKEGHRENLKAEQVRSDHTHVDHPDIQILHRDPQQSSKLQPPGHLVAAAGCSVNYSFFCSLQFYHRQSTSGCPPGPLIPATLHGRRLPHDSKNWQHWGSAT